MSETPQISIILPCFNVAETLEQCLTSIEQQTFTHWEIIAINDGSTDGTLAILQAHATQDKRYCVIDKPNEGYGASCNRGLAAAVGEYIAIVEPDDWILPNMYTDMLVYAARFEEVPDIIKTPYWRIVEPDTSHESRQPCGYKGLIHARQPFTIAEALPLFYHHPSIWSALYRREFLQGNQIRFPELPGAGWADNPFLARTLLSAKRIVYLNKAYYCYREETEEKTRSVMTRQPLLPFERWHDMTDILEQQLVSDPRLLQAHQRRGMVYAAGVLRFHSLEDPLIHEALKALFARVDQALFFDNCLVSPRQKVLYNQIMGTNFPLKGRLGYYRGLAKETVRSLLLLGPRETAKRVKRFLNKKRSA